MGFESMLEQKSDAAKEREERRNLIEKMQSELDRQEDYVKHLKSLGKESDIEAVRMEMENTKRRLNELEPQQLDKYKI